MVCLKKKKSSFSPKIHILDTQKFLRFKDTQPRKPEGNSIQVLHMNSYFFVLFLRTILEGQIISLKPD